MKTIEELFKTYSTFYQFEEGNPEYLIDKEDFRNVLIEFAKMHVEAASKEIYKKHEFYHTTDRYGDREYISQDSILSAYPLTNIK